MTARAINQSEVQSMLKSAVTGMPRRKVYISGPISAPTDAQVAANIARFRKAAQLLRSMGVDAVCPTENGLPAQAEWADHMRADIKLLMDCGGVATLSGWEFSKGAELEVHIAQSLGMRVLPVERWLKGSA